MLMVVGALAILTTVSLLGVIPVHIVQEIMDSLSQRRAAASVVKGFSLWFIGRFFVDVMGSEKLKTA